MSTPAPPPAPPPPPSPSPMPAQATDLIDVGAQVLALNHALQALISSLPEDRRREFSKHFRAFSPEKPSKAYQRVISDMNHAAR